MKKNKKLFIPQVILYNEFKDLEIINTISQGWQNRWTYIKKGTTEAKLWIFTTPRMQFSWIGYDNAIMIESSPPKGSVQVSFVRTQGVFNLNQKVTHNHELIVVYGGEDTNSIISTDNEIFSLVFEETFFDEIFNRYFSKHINSIRKDNIIILKEDNLSFFINKVKYWFDYIQKRKVQTLNTDMFYILEEDIIQHLFSMIYIEKENFMQEKNYAKKARKIIEENIDSVYKISDLVNEFDVGIRTLQYNFQSQYGITPKQYLQNLRLSAVRKELLSIKDNSIKISDVALKYGFFSSSHFTVEYKKFFGETPSETLL